jgi:hypothetical protein
MFPFIAWLQTTYCIGVTQSTSKRKTSQSAVAVSSPATSSSAVPMSEAAGAAATGGGGAGALGCPSGGGCNCPTASLPPEVCPVTGRGRRPELAAIPPSPALPGPATAFSAVCAAAALLVSSLEVISSCPACWNLGALLGLLDWAALPSK